MADNYAFLDGNEAPQTMRAKDIAGAYSPRVIPQVADADVSTANPMPISDAGGSITVDGTVAVTGVATAANQASELTLIGAVTETAPASDTASSGLNGRLQRIAQRVTSLIALLPSSIGQKTGAGSVSVVLASDQGTVPVSIPASELHLGEVGGNTSVVGITFTLDTSAYTSGDVLAVPTQLTAAFRKTDGTGLLQSIVLNDKDDQGVAMYVVVMDANVSLGTINAAASITDANADNILAIVSVETTDWIDLGGCRVATIRNLGIPIKAVSGAATLFVGLITRGTPTHTASGITARFGILRD